jgi:hypothetical protein
MLTKSALIIAMSLAAGSAFAHGGPHFPTPTGGDPFSINLGELGSTSNYSADYAAIGVSTNYNNFAGIMFSVSTAGSLDLFTDDRDDLDVETGSVLYVFKQDSSAHDSDWTLTYWNEEGPRINPGTNHPVNGYGVSISGREPASTLVDTGSADPGVTETFAIGTYLALYVNGFSDSVANRDIGSKLSDGFITSTAIETPQGPVDFYLRAASNSTAVFGPVAPVPVPGAAWLMGSILAGFGAFGRKKAIAA